MQSNFKFMLTTKRAHPIFSLEEILSIIFRYCGSRKSSSGREELDSGTLASLAKTCRSFRNPALDVLYSDTDMACLVRCMPKDLWVIRSIRDHVFLNFQRVMEQEDWDLFLSYTCRVRRLRTRSSYAVNSEIYCALSHPPANSTMFPKLVHLNCGPEAPVEFLLHLIKPILISLSLRFKSGNAIFSDILLSLPSKCPNTRNLKISRSGPRIDEDTTKSILDVVCALPRLQVLWSVEIVLSEKTLSHLAYLPSMTLLEARIPAYPLKEFQKGSGAFRALRRLHLSSLTLGSCIQVLESVASSCISDIHLFVDDGSRDDDLQKAFSLLSAFQNITHLVIIEHARKPSAVPNNYIIDLDMLSPLLRLCNLEHLRLCTQSIFCLDDKDVEKMAFAWPRLELLDLWRKGGWRSGSQITLPGLIPLLQCCPNLQYLGIVVNATTPTAVHSAYDVCTTSKISLSVGDSPIDNPTEVADFLRRIMPNVQHISTWDAFLTGIAQAKEYEARWKQVRELVDGTRRAKGTFSFGDTSLLVMHARLGGTVGWFD
ncbi:hypothetical protein BV22DRAFT_1100914 [Leucogyrophana mollusca]|uniref:Uncharacterized protein n=2 Tax=Leucogyrophana mollusca TaxID=85980 RepID=A0ACB8AV94_9AGAM|nr:hypothetical protein BV22DRAFT_1200301 [Leucogyrophana mollusca]KAH7917700.1 hypothetical protein BV22DRAFT_1100914 [Leucogyrophana mollusca]